MHRLSQINSSGRAPWLVGVPTREADFTACDPRYQHLARQVDLSAIPVFAAAQRDEARDPRVGWADAQRAAHAPSSRCPGSGRAIFYDGYYLKGVGRTQFAWNWNVRRSTMHGTGHLSATGAIRELLISDYLGAVGAGDTIIPCEAVLVRDMDPEFAEPWCRFAAEEGLPLAPVDRRVQAISVKPAGFLRWSNLIHEALQTDLGSGDLLEPLELLYRGLGGEAEDDAITPEVICEAIEASVTRSVDNFRRLYHLGIYWHSFNNNSTLDGRFLDLELASVLGEGHPCGIRYGRSGEAPVERIGGKGVVPGEELAFVVVQARQSIAQVQRVLALAADDLRREPRSREYLRAVAEGMAQLCRREPLTPESIDGMVETIGEMWTARGGDEEQLRDGARQVCAEYLQDANAFHFDDDGQACAHYDLADPEPGVHARVLYPPCSSGPPSSSVVCRARDCFNDALRQLDASQSSEELLERLGPARQRVRAAAAELGSSLQGMHAASAQLPAA
ncbi:MAG: hypothetical protein AAF799_30435 [Myxococcota bacterium]